MKALIVDDSMINLKVAQKLLEHEKITVDTAISGPECLLKVAENSYDVIFMDIMMPEMDGVETFKKLQELPDFNTPVVTLTADAVNGAKEKYLSLGFYAYLAKPININELKEILANLNKNC